MNRYPVDNVILFTGSLAVRGYRYQPFSKLQCNWDCVSSLLYMKRADMEINLEGLRAADLWTHRDHILLKKLKTTGETVQLANLEICNLVGVKQSKAKTLIILFYFIFSFYY